MERALAQSPEVSIHARTWTNTGCGVERGPSHHVRIPISSLAFHTPAMAKNTAIHFQENYDAPVFPTIEHHDPRLPNKTKVWGFDINHDFVAYTEEFVRENGNLVNAKVGGEDVVIAWDEQYESLGVWFNYTGAEVESVDFWGEIQTGQRLTRLETVKAGAYWVVWANFFPQTDINRV